MSPRRNRIEKVVVLREKELDKRIAELTEQKNREQAAKRLLEQEREDARLASQARRKMAENELSAQDWIAANEWLKSRTARAELAESYALKASHVTAHARAEVLNARTDLKKLEVLSSRIAAEERNREERASRRLEDELVAQRFFSERRGGK